MNEPLKPKYQAEAVELFRAQVIGQLLCRDYPVDRTVARHARRVRPVLDRAGVPDRLSRFEHFGPQWFR